MNNQQTLQQNVLLTLVRSFPKLTSISVPSTAVHENISFVFRPVFIYLLNKYPQNLSRNPLSRVVLSTDYFYHQVLLKTRVCVIIQTTSYECHIVMLYLYGYKYSLLGRVLEQIIFEKVLLLHNFGSIEDFNGADCGY